VQSTPTERPSDGRRVTPSRVAIVLILLGIAGLWGYALTRQPQPPPDRIDDSAFAVRAEEICASTAADRDALPQAFETDDPLARADVVEQSNHELEAMLAELRANVPAAERDQRMLDEWLGDWSTYLDNRREYVQRLREDGDTRIYVAEKDGRQITVAVDRFAEVNDMPSCRTPKDIS
jgi:hypothetical protein